MTTKKAGLLYLAKSTKRIMLVYDDKWWSLPTFCQCDSVLKDCEPVLKNFSPGKILPIELYVSNDSKFEFGTFVCLVDSEFLTASVQTVAWASLDSLPKQLHPGLKQTLSSYITRIKLETILELNIDI